MIEERTKWRNEKTYEKKLQSPEPMGMYLTVQRAVAQCGKH